MLTLTHSTNQVTLDANGNMTSDGLHQYDWDAANRLIRISELHPTQGQGAHVSEFTYDGLWRRVEIKEKQGVVTVADRKFIWAGADIKEERDASNATVKRFYGNGVQIVSGSNVGNYFYDRDYLGSIRNVLDANGNVSVSYNYDLWGTRTRTAGTFDTDFGFGSYFEHGPSGLKLTLYRAYSPAQGVWLNRDPIGESGGVNLYGYAGGVGKPSLNLYEYANNNPLTYSDPLGLWATGINVQISTINPFTSTGGGVYGLNFEYTSSNGFGAYKYYTPNQQGSLGLSPGVGVTGNFASGEGAWTGIFESGEGSFGVFSGGIFNSPLEDAANYFGLDFGLGLGFPGVGFTKSQYDPLFGGKGGKCK